MGETRTAWHEEVANLVSTTWKSVNVTILIFTKSNIIEERNEAWDEFHRDLKIVIITIFKMKCYVFLNLESNKSDFYRF